jgi:hypothetical protein
MKTSVAACIICSLQYRKCKLQKLQTANTFTETIKDDYYA